MQLVDSPSGTGYEPEGRQFESVRAHHNLIHYEPFRPAVRHLTYQKVTTPTPKSLRSLAVGMPRGTATPGSLAQAAQKTGNPGRPVDSSLQLPDWAGVAQVVHELTPHLLQLLHENFEALEALGEVAGKYAYPQCAHG